MTVLGLDLKKALQKAIIQATLPPGHHAWYVHVPDLGVSQRCHVVPLASPNRSITVTTLGVLAMLASANNSTF